MIRVTLWAAALLTCIASTTIATSGATAAIGIKAAGPNKAGYPTARVSYGDLALATPAGQKALRDRIWRATKLVCAEPSSAAFDSVAMACRRVTNAKAEPQMLAAIDKASSTQLASTDADLAKDR